MPNKYNVRSNNEWIDSRIQPIAIRVGGSWVPIKEGDFYRTSGALKPILREDKPSFGLRAVGSTMEARFSYNHTFLQPGAVVVIMGSSHSVSFGLPYSQSLQKKLEDNYPGVTFHNIGVPGEYTDHWLPTTMGGLSDRNIDAALAYNPDLILLVGPTNDAQFNTPAQSTANLVTIDTYALSFGVRIVVHSPLPRGSYGAADRQDLADSNVLWQQAFQYRYVPLFNSDLRDKSAGTAAEPNPIYYQGDDTHLNDAGTTYQAAAVIKTLDRQFVPNTAFVNTIMQRSANGSTGWTAYDTVTDQNIVKKSYPKQVGYYREAQTLKDGSTLPVSNVVQITNIAPDADAGPDKSLSAGTTSTTVTDLSTDSDGTIVSRLWTVQSGSGISLVNATGSVVTVNGMVNGGTYVLRITVTDSDGGTDFDDMTITVASAGNVGPIAIAGNDTDYAFGTTSFNLTGSGTDPDGTITGYSWAVISGPNTPSFTATAQNPAVTGAIGGEYVFRLTVTDNGGLTATDDVRIGIVSKRVRVNFSKEAYPVAGWANAWHDPYNENALATVTDQGVTVFARTAGVGGNWNNAVGGENSKNGWGETVDDGGGFYFSPNDAILNYWYNVNDTFDGSKYQVGISGLDVVKRHRLAMLGSRSNANGAAGPYSTAFNLLSSSGNEQKIITNTYRNTSKVATFLDKYPVTGGTMMFAVNRGASGTVGHLNALVIEQF